MTSIVVLLKIAGFMVCLGLVCYAAFHAGKNLG